MNYPHIARKYLNWFEAPAGAEMFYAPGTDYLLRYRDHKTGVIVNSMDFVSKLAIERLSMHARLLMRPRCSWANVNICKE